MHVDLYVATDGDDSNDGMTPGRPKRTIQAAVNACYVGKTVHVKAGTYVLSSTVNINKAITVSGESAATTTIDGNMTCQCFFLNGGATISDMKIVNGASSSMGGGVCCVGGSRITRCYISNNTGKGGGGVCMYGDYTEIRDCVVARNSSWSHGGGIYVYNGAADGVAHMHGATIVNCTVCDNMATLGAFGNKGGGIAISGLDGVMSSYVGEWTPSIIANVVATDNYSNSWFNALDDYASLLYHYGIEPVMASFLYGAEVRPRFDDQANGDYHILSTSECRDRGTNSYVTSSLDLDKRERIGNYDVDVGAYEYNPLSAFQDVYVSTTGLDSNSGASPSSPKLTIGEAIQHCLVGGTVHVAAGTYTLTSPLIVEGIRIEGDDPDTTIIQGNGYAGCCMEVRGSAGSTAYVSKVTVANGKASGIRIYSESQADGGVQVERCIIRDNLSSSNGGGIYVDKTNGHVGIYACLIRSNVSSASGGGVYVDNTYAIELAACTIVDNTASSGGGVYATRTGGGLGFGGLFNSIVYYNTSSQPLSADVVGGGAIAAWSCDIGKSTDSWDPLTITSPPLFMDAGSDDYHLHPLSPCVGAGDYHANYTWIDLDGNEITGNPDMGAYQCQTEAKAVVTGDGVGLGYSPNGTYDHIGMSDGIYPYFRMYGPGNVWLGYIMYGEVDVGTNYRLQLNANYMQSAWKRSPASTEPAGNYVPWDDTVGNPVVTIMVVDKET